MFDGQQLGETIVAQVKGYLEREVVPLKTENEELRARLKALEDRPPPELPPFPDFPEAPELPDIGALVAGAVNSAVASLPKAENGKDAANIVEALKHEGELVLTLEDGRLIRTGIRDGTDGTDAKSVEELTEDDVVVVSAALRKEIGDGKLITLPEPIPFETKSQPPVHVTVENHLPKRGIEKTTVTKHDERGRVIEFERREI